MRNHIYSTTAQIIEELKICICDKNAGTGDVLIKVMKNFTEHVQQCIASEKAHLLQSSCHTQITKVCKKNTCKQIFLPFLTNN
jgi:hypothetical protein